MIPTRPCRWCGDPIAMVRTTNGRQIPLDPVPSDDGNVVVSTTPSGQLVATVVGKNQPPPIGTRFMPHFATCPNYGKAKRRG